VNIRNDSERACAARGAFMLDSHRQQVPRLKRIATPGAPVRILDVEGQVVNVSATGALVHADDALPAGSEWPLMFSAGAEPVTTTARVVRCGALEFGQPMLPARYAIGLEFTESPTAMLDAFAETFDLPATLRRALMPRRVLVLGGDSRLVNSISVRLTEAGYLARAVPTVPEILRVARRSGADIVVSALPLEHAQTTRNIVEMLAADGATRGIPVLGCVDELESDQWKRAALVGRSLTCTPRDLEKTLDTLIDED
jgi:hypothetical protein